MKKKNPFQKNKHEIIYNFINCGMAGGLVFLGSISTGELSLQGFTFGIIAFLTAFITKFKSYWAKERPEYSRKLFNFIQM